MSDREQILAFWFGDLDASGRADQAHGQRWWTKDPGFDRMLAERFGKEVEAALAGELEAWHDAPRGTLAYVLLLDQMTRNIYRDTAGAFAGDERAFAAAERGIAAGHDRSLKADERAFLYMPLMHREDLVVQDRAVALFEQLATDPAGLYALDFARKHRDVIARFGRFPHRNALLGRVSTTAELDYLAQPGSGF